MRALLLLTLAAGCTKSAAGDSLVVITVDAVPALMSVALLHTTSMAGGDTIDHDVGDGTPFALGGGVTKSFGVQVPSSISGDFTIHVEARDAAGQAVGAGDGMTTVASAQRRDLTVTLGPVTVNHDDGGSDGGVDGGSDSGVDGMVVPPILTQSVWIATGGSASSVSQRLNLNSGGSDTVGTSVSPSGATFTSGLFAHQTY